MIDGQKDGEPILFSLDLIANLIIRFHGVPAIDFAARRPLDPQTCTNHDPGEMNA